MNKKEATEAAEQIITSQQTTVPDLPAAITLGDLQKQFGKVTGEKLYHEISIAGGYGDYRNETFVGGMPALSTAGLTDEYESAVQAVWTGAHEAKQ